MIESSRLLARVVNVRHGFSTRIGGVSTGMHAEMNLSFDVGDVAERVAENRRRFLAGVGGNETLTLAEAHQVHGTDVAQVRSLSTTRKDAHVNADALVTAHPFCAVAVRTADCAPILVAHIVDGRAVQVAAIHAGWRGAVAGVVKSAIGALAAGDPRECIAAVGPTIGIDAFEVGDDVIDAARRCLDGRNPPTKKGLGGRQHLDLRALVVRQLEQLGIPLDQVECVGGCTASDPSRYFSHRRDRGQTGRHLSAIAFVPP